MLTKIIYVSTRATRDVQLQKQEHVDIRKSSERNNSHEDITGILIATRSHFIQVLEGEAEDLEKVFSRIKKDERHYKVALKSDRLIKRRLFGSWAMNVVHIDSIAGVLYGYRFDLLDMDPYAMTYSAIAELIKLSGPRD